MADCGGCIYFRRDVREEYKTQGHCRRYPPVLVWALYLQSGDWMQDRPYVPETEWCGEFVAMPRTDDLPF